MNANRQRSEAAEHRNWRAAILAEYGAASAAERRAGRDWYATAADAADQLGETYGVDTATAAAVIAVLSPRTRWNENLRAAESAISAASAARETGAPIRPAVLAATRSYGLTLPREKAAAILSGAPIAENLGRGPKVPAFFANILGCRRTVTVDVWAARAAGWRGATLTDRTYARIADAYRAAADQLGVPARDLQAAVWVHVRGAAT